MGIYDIRTTPEFDVWLTGIREASTRQRLVARLRKATLGNFGDVSPISAGIWEMREHFGSGWRMYYIQRCKLIVLMLGGGIKSTQTADIKAVKKLLQTLEV